MEKNSRIIYSNFANPINWLQNWADWLTDLTVHSSYRTQYSTVQYWAYLYIIHTEHSRHCTRHSALKAADTPDRSTSPTPPECRPSSPRPCSPSSPTCPAWPRCCSPSSRRGRRARREGSWDCAGISELQTPAIQPTVKKGGTKNECFYLINRVKEIRYPFN